MRNYLHSIVAKTSVDGPDKVAAEHSQIRDTYVAYDDDSIFACTYILCGGTML
jgi:hypothetical protein